MDTRIESALSKIVKVLKDRGFEKEAASMEQMLGPVPHIPITRRPTLTQNTPMRTTPTETPSNQTFAKPGEIITSIGPDGKERLMIWGLNKPMSVEEIEQGLSNGDIPTKLLIEHINKARDPNSKKFFEIMLNRAHKELMVKKLATLGQSLISNGYDALAQRLFGVREKISKL